MDDLATWYHCIIYSIKCQITNVHLCRRPLELDTDGIWCILPASFPENFQVRFFLYGTLSYKSHCSRFFLDTLGDYNKSQEKQSYSFLPWCNVEHYGKSK